MAKKSKSPKKNINQFYCVKCRKSVQVDPESVVYYTSKRNGRRYYWKSGIAKSCGHECWKMGVSEEEYEKYT
jgi:hypothetical protein